MARDFAAELRREEALREAEGIPDGVRRSIRSRIEQSIERRQGGPRRARAPLFVGAVAALVILAALAVFELRGPSHLGEFQVARESDDLRAQVRGGLVEIDRGAITLVDPATGVTLESSGPVALRREPSGVRVVRGRTNISVQKRAPGASPVTILVSHGAIQVLGTSFTVFQGPSGGSVLLHEGHIQFRGEDNVVHNLRPGEELKWPLASPSAPASPTPSPPQSAGVAPPRVRTAPQPSAPTPIAAAPSTSPTGAPSAPQAAPSASSTEELLDRVEALRGRHQFEAAARELARGIPSQPKAMRERLSFELGSLLTHQIHDRRRACAHWAAHERNFQGGRYREEVARSRRALACEGGPNAP
jgi:transmembrane sensor